MKTQEKNISSPAIIILKKVKSMNNKITTSKFKIKIIKLIS